MYQSTIHNREKADLVLITRFDYQQRQTLGFGVVLDILGNVLFTFKTLELPDLNNQRNISCITPGAYVMQKHSSARLGNHFDVHGVLGRTFIALHFGNFFSDIEGCILAGDKHAHINSDKHLDVSNTHITLARLTHLLQYRTKLIIK